MGAWLGSNSERVENLARNDLTGAERKAFAAEVGRLIAKISEDCQGEEFANGSDVNDGNWVGEMAKATGTPTKTLYNTNFGSPARAWANRIIPMV